MRHYFAYHNAKKMKYSSTTITEPHARTKKSIVGLEGVTVWLIAGEGTKSPKSFFISSMFIAEHCHTNKFTGDLPNEISGEGTLYKLTKPITGTVLMDQLKDKTANLRYFQEIKDITIINSLLKLSL